MCIYIYIYTYVCVYIYIYIYTYVYMCMGGPPGPQQRPLAKISGGGRQALQVDHLRQELGLRVRGFFSLFLPGPADLFRLVVVSDLRVRGYIKAIDFIINCVAHLLFDAPLHLRQELGLRASGQLSGLFVCLFVCLLIMCVHMYNVYVCIYIYIYIHTHVFVEYYLVH